MKNENCISLSLYGEKIYYYLPIVFNIDLINKSNLPFDIVIRTNQECKDLLISILNHENIKYDNVNFEIMPIVSKYSRGMFWKFNEFYLDRYKHIYFGDADVYFIQEQWWVIFDFFKRDIPFGTYNRLTCNGHLLDCGQILCNTRFLNEDFKLLVKKACNIIDNEEIINYDMDQIILEKILKPYMNNGNMIVYNDMDSNRYKHYNNIEDYKIRLNNLQLNYKNIIDMTGMNDLTVDRVYKQGWYIDDFFKNLIGYDLENKIYTINDKKYDFKKDYDGTSSNLDNTKINQNVLDKIKELGIN